MEEAFFDMPLYREFAQLDGHGRRPDESTILRFRHRLEKHKLADGILASVNEVLSRQGLVLRQGKAAPWTPRLLLRQVRRRTKTASATPRCIRARRAISGILE